MSVSTQPSGAAKKYDERTIVNFPNEVTTVRLGLSVVLFVLLQLHLYWAGFWLFLITAGTHWVHGFLGRPLRQNTFFGPIGGPIGSMDFGPVATDRLLFWAECSIRLSTKSSSAERTSSWRLIHAPDYFP